MVEGAVHHLDILADFAGARCDTLYAQTWNPPWGEFAGDSQGLVTLRFENGARAIYEGAKTNAVGLNGWGQEYFRAETEGATLVLDHRQVERFDHDPSRARSSRQLGEGEPVPLLERPHWAHGWLTEQFLDWLDGGEPMPTNVEDNLQSVALIFAAIESSRTGQPVRVQELLQAARAADEATSVAATRRGGSRARPARADGPQRSSAAGERRYDRTAAPAPALRPNGLGRSGGGHGPAPTGSRWRRRGQFHPIEPNGRHPMPKTVVIIAALDTKGEEAELLRDLIAARGRRDADRRRRRARRARHTRPGQPRRGRGGRRGRPRRARRAPATKARAMAAMTRGAAAVAARLHAEGRLDGIIGLGGSAGTTIASSAMRALPVGVPKLIVSTVASGDTRPYVGSKDIAHALLGRRRRRDQPPLGAHPDQRRRRHRRDGRPPSRRSCRRRPLLAASMFGNTTACVDRARASLEARRLRGAGLPRHRGRRPDDGEPDRRRLHRGRPRRDHDRVGRRALRRESSAPARPGSTPPAQAGIPQVIAPGCLDMVNFGGAGDASRSATGTASSTTGTRT